MSPASVPRRFADDAVRVLTCVAVVLAATSCGSGRDALSVSGSPPVGTGDGNPNSHDDHLTDYTTPLEQITYDAIVDDPASVGALVRILPVEYAVIFAAGARSGADCMHDAGFPEFPVDVYVPAALYDPAGRPAEEGYHLAPGDSGGAQSSMLDAWIDETPGAAEAWGGDGVSTGCLAASEAAVFGSPSGFMDDMAAFTVARNEWINDVSSNKDVAALDAEWSSCMTAAGMPAGDPTVPWRSAWPGDVPASDEIEMRSVDLRCRSEVDYSARMASLLGPAFDAWLAKNAAMIRATRDSVAKWLVRATIVAERP